MYQEPKNPAIDNKFTSNHNNSSEKPWEISMIYTKIILITCLFPFYVIILDNVFCYFFVLLWDKALSKQKAFPSSWTSQGFCAWIQSIIPRIQVCLFSLENHLFIMPFIYKTKTVLKPPIHSFPDIHLFIFTSSPSRCLFCSSVKRIVRYSCHRFIYRMCYL